MYWIAQRLLNFLWKKKNTQKAAEIWEWYWPLIKKLSNVRLVAISFVILKFTGDIVVKKSWISTMQKSDQFYSCKR